MQIKRVFFISALLGVLLFFFPVSVNATFCESGSSHCEWDFWGCDDDFGDCQSTCSSGGTCNWALNTLDSYACTLHDFNCVCNYIHEDYNQEDCSGIWASGSCCYWEGSNICVPGGWICEVHSDCSPPSCPDRCFWLSGHLYWQHDNSYLCMDGGWNPTCNRETDQCNPSGCCDKGCTPAGGCEPSPNNANCNAQPGGRCQSDCTCCYDECSPPGFRCQGTMIQQCKGCDKDICWEWCDILQCTDHSCTSGCWDGHRTGCWSDGNSAHCTGCSQESCNTDYCAFKNCAADSCTFNTLQVGPSTCDMYCTGNNADCKCGDCSCAKTTYTCNDATHSECQHVVCGGTTYYCTNYGGSPGTWGSWGWRTSDLCQDGICDYCSGGRCQHQTSNEGRNCNDDCTHCVDIGGPHSTCDDRLQCDGTECPAYGIPQGVCNVDGGNCADPDWNNADGNMTCENFVVGLHCFGESHNWMDSPAWGFGVGTQAFCCGDDANEFLITTGPYTNRTGDSATSVRCCDDSTDCVYVEFGTETCYNNGDRYDIDGDGDTDYCSNTQWLDCWDDTDCNPCWNCTLSTNTCNSQPNQWDGNKCWDDCTFCNATPKCQDRPFCNYTECRTVGWIYYVSDQAACDADGGDCSDPDWNDVGGQAVCEGDVVFPTGGCFDVNHSQAYAGPLWSFEQPLLGIPECCGDDPFEYYTEASYAIGMWDTPYDDMCCDNATDCVIDTDQVDDLPDQGVKCFASGITSIACQVNIDNDLFDHKDFCNKGMWMPCASNYTLTITGPYGIADEIYDATLPPEAFIPLPP